MACTGTATAASRRSPKRWPRRSPGARSWAHRSPSTSTANSSSTSGVVTPTGRKRPPGAASGYHAVNYGHLIGEVIRRATGKTLKEFVRDEIARPLGADVQIGAREQDYGRIAELIPPPPLELPLDLMPADHPMIKTF